MNEDLYFMYTNLGLLMSPGMVWDEFHLMFVSEMVDSIAMFESTCEVEVIV